MEEKIYVCNIRNGCNFKAGRKHCGLYWGMKYDHIRFRHKSARLITGEDCWCGCQIYVEEIKNGHSG